MVVKSHISKMASRHLFSRNSILSIKKSILKETTEYLQSIFGTSLFPIEIIDHKGISRWIIGYRIYHTMGGTSMSPITVSPKRPNRKSVIKLVVNVAII